MVAELTSDTGIQPPDLSSLCLAVTGHSPLPMAAVEGAGHIVRYVNPAFCRLMDRSTEQLVGKSFGEMLPEQDKCVTLLDSVFRTGTPGSHGEQQHSQPHPVFWSYTMWPVLADDHPVGIMIQVTEIKQLQKRMLAMNEALMLGSIRQHELTAAANSSNALLQAEISERRRTEEALRASELSYRRLFEAAKDGILILEADTGRITDVNPFLIKLLGFSHSEMVGKTVGELSPFKDIESNQVMLERLQKDGYVRYEDLPLETKGGRHAAVEFVSNVYQAGDKKVIQCNIRDITDRKRADHDLVAAKDELSLHAQHLEETVRERTGQLRETISELEEFSYSVSHDMRAPLRAMQSYGQYLVDEYDGKLDEKGVNYLQQIMRSAVRLDRLIQDVLSYTRILHSPLPMEPVDLDRLVRDIIETYPNGQPIRPEIRIKGELPKVLGNEALLTQCISNLLSNGAKFVSPGTTPRLEISAEARDESMIRVWFKDNGIGIAPENHERIFRLLERIHPATEYEGTGIGLTIVRKAIERMGAQVGFESELGKGSKFWIQLEKG